MASWMDDPLMILSVDRWMDEELDDVGCGCGSLKHIRLFPWED